MKVANILTLSRLLLAPLFLLVFLDAAHGGYGETSWGPWAALGLTLGFEVTDMVDGFVARRLQQTSQLGKILDPLADSVSRFTVFLGFLVMGYASVWAIACIFYRDSIVSFVRIMAASRGVIVSARASGKIKAIVQGVAINVLLFLNCMRGPFGMTAPDAGDDPLADVIANPVMWLVAAVTLWSLVDYLAGNRKLLAELDA